MQHATTRNYPQKQGRHRLSTVAPAAGITEKRLIGFKLGGYERFGEIRQQFKAWGSDHVVTLYELDSGKPGGSGGGKHKLVFQRPKLTRRREPPIFLSRPLRPDARSSPRGPPGGDPLDFLIPPKALVVVDVAGDSFKTYCFTDAKPGPSTSC
jgi:hypothetical protein